MTDATPIMMDDGGAETATANAIKASGAIVHVEPQDFEAILSKSEAPLVVRAEGGFLSRKYSYLTSYKGLIFYTKTPIPVRLPIKAELIAARKIWTPQ